MTTIDYDREIVRLSKDVLKLLDGGKHWTKGNFEYNGSYCLMGAVYKTNYGFRIHAKWRYSAKEVLGLSPLVSMLGWNDTPERTWPEVDQLLHKMIRKHRQLYWKNRYQNLLTRVKLWFTWR